MSSKLRRNWSAMARARPAHCPAVRISLGRSFGPTTTNATIRITNSSLQAISNMQTDTSCSEARRRTLRASWRIGQLSLLDLFGLLGLDGFVLVHNRTLVVRVFKAFLEIPDSVRDIAHDPGNLAPAAEQNDHNGQHDEPMPNCKTTHVTFSRSHGYWRPASQLCAP